MDTEVAGRGVVGTFPILKPGRSYQYSSGTSSTTASTLIMKGTFQFLVEKNRNTENVDVHIAPLKLTVPHS